MFTPLLRRFAAASLALCLLGASAPASAQMTPAQRSEVEAIVKDFLVKNPEVLRDAFVELERRQKADEEANRSRAIAELAPLIFDNPRQAVFGNPKGKITLVEFFDYNCGYCKRALDDISAVLKDEKDVRFILKDFPVLGPGSVEAAEVAIAMLNQANGDKYWQFHQKLLATRGQVAKAQALAAAKEVGADMDRLTKDIASPQTRGYLQEIMKIADRLQLTGTPTFVLADDVIVGAVGRDELKARIANVRKCGKNTCG
jgi:protein-disulfide isomerase